MRQKAYYIQGMAPACAGAERPSTTGNIFEPVAGRLGSQKWCSTVFGSWWAASSRYSKHVVRYSFAFATTIAGARSPYKVLRWFICDSPPRGASLRSAIMHCSSRAASHTSLLVLQLGPSHSLRHCFAASAATFAYWRITAVSSGAPCIRVLGAPSG